MVPETTARKLLRLANGGVGGAKVFERSVVDLRLQDARDSDEVRPGVAKKEQATNRLPQQVVHLQLSVAASVRGSGEIDETKQFCVSLLMDLETRIGWSKCLILETDVVEGSHA